MNRDFWGPSLWRSIHSFAVTYTPDKAVYFKQFIYSLPGIIPCPECSEHLKVNLARVLPLKEKWLKNNETLFMWTYHLHDIVNKQGGKKSPPFETIWKMYFGNKPCNICK